MSYISSAWWIIIIIVAAVSLAVANICYPIVKQREEKHTMAITIEQTLKPELESNLEIAKKLKERAETGKFDSGAWSVISNSNFLLGIEPKKRGDLIKAYVLINKANECYSKLLDIDVTPIIIGSPNNSINVKRRVSSEFWDTLDKLIPLLSSLTKSVD